MSGMEEPGPKGLSAVQVNTLNAAVQVASKTADIVQKLRALGAEPVTETAEQFARFIADEVQKSGDIVRQAGIKPEG